MSNNQYPKLIDKIDDLEENIKFNSYCLKQYGNDILDDDTLILTKTLELIEREHNKWIKPFLRKQNEL